MTDKLYKFMPLFDLAKLVVGQPLTDKRPNAEAMNLIGYKVHECDTWDVPAKPIETEYHVSYDYIYSLPHFIEWARGKGIIAPMKLTDEVRERFGFSKSFELLLELESVNHQIADLQMVKGSSVEDIRWRDEQLKGLSARKNDIVNSLSFNASGEGDQGHRLPSDNANLDTIKSLPNQRIDILREIVSSLLSNGNLKQKQARWPRKKIWKMAVKKNHNLFPNSDADQREGVFAKAYNTIRKEF